MADETRAIAEKNQVFKSYIGQGYYGTQYGVVQSIDTVRGQSQTGEGWVALPTHYDDGGFSGGNMERPGLKHLMADMFARAETSIDAALWQLLAKVGLSDKVRFEIAVSDGFERLITRGTGEVKVLIEVAA